MWRKPIVTGRRARGSPVLPSAETTQPAEVRARYKASVACVSVHRRDLERLAIRQLELALLADHLDHAAHAERDLRRVIAHRPLEHARVVVARDERLRLRDRDALAIGQRDVPHHALEQRERGRRAADRELQAHDRARGAAGRERLALEHDPGREHVGLRAQIELRDAS